MASSNGLALVVGKSKRGHWKMIETFCALQACLCAAQTKQVQSNAQLDAIARREYMEHVTRETAAGNWPKGEKDPSPQSSIDDRCQGSRIMTTFREMKAEIQNVILPISLGVSPGDCFPRLYPSTSTIPAYTIPALYHSRLYHTRFTNSSPRPVVVPAMQAARQRPAPEWEDYGGHDRGDPRPVLQGFDDGEHGEGHPGPSG